MIMIRYMALAFLLFCQMFGITMAYAGVTMAGTRVVFPAESKDQSLQFSNKDNLPFLVQIWVDQGNDQSTPETADAPFMVNPQVFRINPQAGQTARLFYTGDGQLPKDRESIYYLNFKQIPAMSKDVVDQNKLVLIVKNRFKIFYRPKTIVGKVEDVPKQLRYRLQQDAKGIWLQINNPTGYYANLTQAFIKVGEQTTEMPIGMVAPKSSEKWLVQKNMTHTASATVTVTLVTDYGAYTKYDLIAQP
ncbi:MULTISPECIES: molecular chaperone [unclassified Acinetobacter]|uniref:fimbrial biogenesis chaperone n=1 Tax=unclassified Acinetobacter TaxID=196816 RepID=UPI00244B2567|nr:MULTISPECIES: molecular chaperone [unclassified Acinetobacter]MDH0031303.1 molecular chaperone [Acinetobacter sp. GD04021]MDH0887048.1 molecular chaperone [Acinetobacter sp. GD03873]MDH1083499.1 molecular chaperone [Acinetobacter sp. GD03983]MDH2190364.1 molecular chaperone [Acinetobacter sp. GD03645]MDH2203693.1 molecular chaperone [Acinetobacter sp. GD03647]